MSARDHNEHCERVNATKSDKSRTARASRKRDEGCRSLDTARTCATIITRVIAMKSDERHEEREYSESAIIVRDHNEHCERVNATKSDEFRRARASRERDKCCKAFNTA
jgi:hypothetical protein